MRIARRYGEVDLARLPRNPSPPDCWQEGSACYGTRPETFFPRSEEAAGPALAFCHRCPTRTLCLAWALRNGERYGVWGGLTEQQRRRLDGPLA